MGHRPAAATAEPPGAQGRGRLGCRRLAHGQVRGSAISSHLRKTGTPALFAGDAVGRVKNAAKNNPRSRSARARPEAEVQYRAVTSRDEEPRGPPAVPKLPCR